MDFTWRGMVAHTAPRILSCTLVAGLLAEGQYPEGLATGHLGTDFLGFPVFVYK